jgi:methylenetetrahydrofolate--tRNA-(uracil-5-)-methyltransferase
VIGREGLYFAGQITGVEGYVESAGSGLVAGISLAEEMNGKAVTDFPSYTALGSLGKHVSTPNQDFQPMNCTFGLIDPLPYIPGQKRIRKKQEKYEAIAARALEYVTRISKVSGGV